MFGEHEIKIEIQLLRKKYVEFTPLFQTISNRKNLFSRYKEIFYFTVLGFAGFVGLFKIPSRAYAMEVPHQVGVAQVVRAGGSHALVVRAEGSRALSAQHVPTVYPQRPKVSRLLNLFKRKKI